jgi:hypothetical protein
LAAHRLVWITPRLVGSGPEENPNVAGAGLIGAGLIGAGLIGDSQDADILLLQAICSRLADAAGRSGEEAVVEALLIHFRLRSAFQEVAGAFGFDGQEALAIVELPGKIWMPGRPAHLKRDALVGTQAAMFEESVVGIGEEVK